MKKYAWAIINKKKPIINIYEIYPSKKDVKLVKGEKFIRVCISEYIAKK